jgi:GntR family transcriptional regulator
MTKVPPFKAQKKGPDYIYVQFADWIAARIATKELRPGTRLPAERDLSKEHGIAYLTVRRATALLRDRDLIETIVGRGTYVKAKKKDK